MLVDDLVGLKELISFLNKLEKNNIYYRLSKVRNESIMVEIAVPSQRREIRWYS